MYAIPDFGRGIVELRATRKDAHVYAVFNLAYGLGVTG